MEQRRLRLGDIVDDYCPRERRVTNHAVVAMIEEDVKQTRCSTCEAEHPYKGGHAPRRRKKDAPGALYQEVLAGMPDADASPALATPPAPVAASPDIDAAPVLVAGPASAAVDPPVPAIVLEPEPPAPVVEDGPVHRQLIRAQLPRIEGQKEVRQTPEFTIRQAGGRAAGNFHGGGGADQRGRPRGAGQGQGQPSNRPSGGGRFAGARASNQGQGAPQGRRPSGGGFHAAQPQGRNGNGNGNGTGAGGGGRKRSR